MTKRKPSKTTTRAKSNFGAQGVAVRHQRLADKVRKLDQRLIAIESLLATVWGTKEGEEE